MDLKRLATQIIMQKFGAADNEQAASSALDELTGGKSEFDLAEVVGQFTGSGGELAAKARSWLSDDANDAITGTQVREALGSEKIAAFANRLGIDEDEASDRLSDVLPQLIDKSSRGGNLLDSVGGARGLLGFGSKFF